MKSDRDKDLYYLSLRARYLEACSIIGNLASAQAEDRRLLIAFESGKLNEKRLRHQLAQRRLGRNGLRSLNKAINRFYRYCNEKGY